MNALLCAVLAAQLAPLPPDPPDTVDLDRLDGPSRVETVVGFGALTATLDDTGTVTGLRWPHPLAADQLHHATASMPDERLPHPLLLPRRGARVTDGVRLGLRITDDAGATLLWLDDPGFTRRMSYASDTSRVVRLVAEHPRAEVVLEAWVEPDEDVLRMALEVVPRGPVTSLQAFVAAHPAPSTALPAYVPGADVLEDRGAAGRARVGIALAQDRAMLSVLPAPALEEAALRALATSLLASPGFPVDPALVAAALEPFSEVTLALAVDRPAQLHVGASDDGAAVLRPMDAFADVVDGALSANTLHAGDHTMAALVDLPAAGRSGVTFVVAAAATPAAALDAVGRALLVPAVASRQQAERAVEDLARTVALPSTADENVRALALRSITLLQQSTAPSGAMAGSVAAQPFLAVDREVEAAFTDLALVDASLPRAAVAHRAWWSGRRRTVADPDGPAGTTPTAVYADGRPASVTPWAQDALALGLWADAVVPLRMVARVVGSPPAAVDAVEDRVPLAAEALLACVEGRASPCRGGSWLEPAGQADTWTLAAVVAALWEAPGLLGGVGEGELAQRLADARPPLQQRLDETVAAHAAVLPAHVLALALGPARALAEDPGPAGARALALDALMDHLDALLRGSAEGPRLVRAPFLCTWVALQLAAPDRARRARAEGLVDQFLARATLPSGHVGLSVAPHPVSPGATLLQLNGTPSAMGHATLLLTLYERHGRSPPAALPLPALPVPRPGSCAGAPPPEVLPLLACGAWSALRRRRRAGNALRHGPFSVGGRFFAAPDPRR